MWNPIRGKLARHGKYAGEKSRKMRSVEAAFGNWHFAFCMHFDIIYITTVSLQN